MSTGCLFCACGMTLDTTAGMSYSVATFDQEGTMIYGVCQHGVVVIDRRPKPNKNQIIVEEDDGERD